MTGSQARELTWQVLVPTRGSVDAVRRIHHNIVSQLPARSVTLVLNSSTAGPSMEAGRAAAVELGMATVDCAGGGASRARNTGLDVATRPFVVFLDDDVVASTEAVEVLVSTVQRAGAAIGTARVLALETLAPSSVLWRRYLGFDRGETTRLWGGHGGAVTHVSPFGVWAFGVGAAFVVNMAVLTTGGGLRFDERLSNGRWCGGTEDVDFFYTAHTRGLAVVYVADAVVWHVFPADRRGLRTKCRQYALADGAFYAKWIQHASLGDLVGEFAGWLRRVRLHIRRSLRAEAAIPLGTLLAEPLYKLVGAFVWYRRRPLSSSPRTDCATPW